MGQVSNLSPRHGHVPIKIVIKGCDIVEDNPYSPPNTPAKSSGRFRIVRWALLCVAILLIIVSLPTAWHTLELANQEYLHLWNSRSVIHDIEINGSPVSMATAIRHGVTAVLVQWSLAAVLILARGFFGRSKVA